MSSIFGQEHIDFKSHDVIYASAQENFGQPGVCITILSKEAIQRASEAGIPDSRLGVTDWGKLS
jgi:phosphoserine aminotransferase